MPHRGSIAACATLLCLVSTFARTSLAQRDASTPPDTLSTVTVTVLRTPLDATAVPFSVARRFDDETTANRPHLTVDDALGRLASVQVDNRLNFAVGERIAIRGIGARAQFGIRGVHLVLDGIPATFADGQSSLTNLDLGTLGAVEVLRGPASSLYGNAAGGVVLMRTAAPSRRPWATSIELIAGSDGLQRLQLGGSGTAGAWGYRIGASHLQYDGYRDYADTRNTHANAMASYTTGRTRITLILNTVDYRAHNPGSLSDSLLQIDRRQAYGNNVLHQTGERGQQTQSGVNAELPLAGGSVHMSVYAAHRGIDNPIPPAVVALSRNAAGFRAYYVRKHTGRDWSLLTTAGMAADQQHDDRQNYANDDGMRGALTLDQREHVRSLAPFGQLSLAAGPVQLLAGIRHDAFRFTVHDRFVTSENPDDSGNQRMSATSTSFGATYALGAHTLYGNVATAFQTPTTSELANRVDGAGGFNPSLRPEHIHSVETGLNGMIRSRVTYHAAWYRLRATNALVPFEVASFPGRTFYRNVGAATHRGAEAELRLAWSAAVLVSASYGYLDARVDAVADSTDHSIVGRRVPGITPHMISVSVDVRAESGRRVTAEFRAQSRTPANDANTVSSAGALVTNVRGSLPVTTRTALIGGLSNLFDVTYNAAVVANAAGGRYFEPAAGRTAYLGIRWNAE